MKGMRLSDSAPTPMLVEENIPLPQLERAMCWFMYLRRV